MRRQLCTKILLVTLFALGAVRVSVVLGQARSAPPATLPGQCPPVQNTPRLTIVYGTLTVSGAPGEVGIAVEARSPRGDTVGCFVVQTAGHYGGMFVYGEDTTADPPIPGMRSGETVSFYVDALQASASPSLAWQDDKDIHEVNLSVELNYPPTNGTVIPPSGSGPVGVTTSFTTTWHDANGWQDLKHCYFHIGASPSIVGNVTMLYNAAKDKLWIRSDDGDTWTGGCTPSTVGSIENGQAIVSCDETWVTGSEDTLTVTWTIEFKPGYTGAKKTGLKCRDRSRAKAKGQWKAAWTIY
jgi:hypothetical protein